MDMWLEQADNIERWESNSLMGLDRRVLIMQWVGAAMQELDSREEYRFRLFEKCGIRSIPSLPNKVCSRDTWPSP